jgi:CO/xanthine dehydrogenase FAD-binding subunit
MPAKPSQYYRPQSLEEALRYLERPETKPLAGGTKLIAEGFFGAVVDLQDAGLDQVMYGDGCLTLGSMTKLADLSEFVSEEFAGSGAYGAHGPESLLLDSIHRAGPNTYRNVATAGGVIASRLPDSEFLASLMVLDAEVSLIDREERKMPVREYLAASERPAGLIVEVVISWSRGKGAAERVARTPADYPIVSVTAFKPEEANIRLAATGIDSRPLCLDEVEEALRSNSTVEEAAKAARNMARHPGDFRGDAGYRAEMAYVLTKRVLDQLL